GIDPSITMIPVAPAAHYTMGGIPTNNSCQVVKYDTSEEVVSGLYAIGEAACISVHGAGRLGCNSLLDLLVFAKKAVDSLNKVNNQNLRIPECVANAFMSVFIGEEADIEAMTIELKDIMSQYVGVFRSAEGLIIALQKMNILCSQYEKAAVSDKSLQWNIELQHFLELGNMLVSALITIKSALWREESRGAHWRYDFPESNNRFSGHTICNYRSDKKIKIRSVRMSANNVDFYQPNSRNY
ncbi:MAG: FAD-binding protein, partial [Rickettsiaceae bacterium]|nr:FAD-binding protein [Rickettsiaceae bacterium]